jgi:DnaJ-class molecular chaperone
MVGQTDEEQFRGQVSIDCPECDYHETHNLKDEVCPLCAGFGDVPTHPEKEGLGETCNLCGGTGLKQ